MADLRVDQLVAHACDPEREEPDVTINMEIAERAKNS